MSRALAKERDRSGLLGVVGDSTGIAREIEVLLQSVTSIEDFL